MQENAELLHDLRMPLQLVLSCAQLLEREVSQNKRAMGYVDMLMGSVRQMQNMLTGSLERKRPEAGEVCFRRCELVSHTWELCARCQLYAHRVGAQLLFHANCDRLELALDEEKYGRILMNLLSNALKFAPGGEIHVTVRALGDFVEVSVQDNGCGIVPERMGRIFELHETDSGYVYGLYIAREYARLLGGRLSAESEAGKGSVFTLRLPVQSVESAL